MLSNVKVALVAVTLGLGVGLLVGYQVAKGGYDEPIPVVPLPPKVVPVTVVKTIKVPGPARVVERVHLVTKTVEVPVEKLKVVAGFVKPVGRVRLDANKFEGMSEGHLKFGWKGHAVCEFRPEDEPNAWTELVESPFDLTESKAETTIAPVPLATRLRLDVGGGISSDGPLVQVGIAKRLTRKSFLGKAFLPDWVGVSGAYSSLGHAQILVTASKEF